MPERIDRLFAGADNVNAVISAMSESVRLLAESNRGIGEVLKGIQAEVKDIRERVIRIEATEFKAEINRLDLKAETACGRLGDKVDDLCLRIDALESKEDRRAGALSLAEWGLHNWPGIILAIITIVTVLVANNKVHLP